MKELAQGDILGLSEAADLMGWSKQHLKKYMYLKKFPEPLLQLKATPIWSKEQIEEYKASRKPKNNPSDPV